MNRFISAISAGLVAASLAAPAAVSAAGSGMEQGAVHGLGGRYFAKGIQLVGQGKPDTGLPYLAASVAMGPENMHRQTYLALFLDLPQHRSDLALMESLHRVSPRFIPVTARLAALYEGKQRMAEAEALYREWIALTPDQAEPYARLGEHYYFTKQYKKALKAFQQHRQLVGESAYALRRMARIQLDLGHNRAAKKLLKKLRKIDDSAPSVKEMMARMTTSAR